MITIYSDKVIIDELPMPPSENAMYDPVVRRNKEGRVFASNRPAKELSQYQKDFESWHWQHVQSMTKVEKKISTWASEHEKTAAQGMFGIRLSIFAVFLYEDLVSKQEKLKKLDASNRAKALQDCLSKALHIDDNVVVNTSVEKSYDEKKRCVVIIEPHEMSHINRAMREHL